MGNMIYILCCIQYTPCQSSRGRVAIGRAGQSTHGTRQRVRGRGGAGHRGQKKEEARLCRNKYTYHTYLIDVHTRAELPGIKNNRIHKHRACQCSCFNRNRPDRKGRSGHNAMKMTKPMRAHNPSSRTNGDGFEQYSTTWRLIDSIPHRLSRNSTPPNYLPACPAGSLNVSRSRRHFRNLDAVTGSSLLRQHCTHFLAKKNTSYDIHPAEMHGGLEDPRFFHPRCEMITPLIGGKSKSHATVRRPVDEARKAERTPQMLPVCVYVCMYSIQFVNLV